MDPRTFGLVGGVLLLLGAASGLVQFLKHRHESGVDPAIVETFRLRVRSWWILFSVLSLAFFLWQWLVVLLFGFLGFWALREFITLTPTRPSDHRTLFFVFFVFTPLQFILVIADRYGLYGIMIPVYGFLFVPAAIALAGDHKRFLERTAKIQAGLLICVYCLSFAPALMTLKLPPLSDDYALREQLESYRESPDRYRKELPAPLGEKERAVYERYRVKTLHLQAELKEGLIVPADFDRDAEKIRKQSVDELSSADVAGKARLLFFFILMVQLSDALQYLWAQLPSKHVIVPAINPSRTWEGLLGGTASVTLIGSVLWWATPFHGGSWWMSGIMSGVISLMSFAGGITMSAVKRDRGVKDYGTLVEGHGGLLDRIDSICFAAPVFFHCTRWWLILNGYMDPIP
ncbi:MAG: phosphatidate cytidylyltransferase [Pirellulales bacterium]|nr:phosphatidate cytidylyltransferase [Pirellulales bacterium]